jgi:hypothetical protein
VEFNRYSHFGFQWLGCAGDDARAELWIAIVQNADSPTLFDDPDAALQSGPSEKTRGHAAAVLLKFERLSLKLISTNYRSGMPSDYCDFGKFARSVRGAPKPI